MVPSAAAVTLPVADYDADDVLIVSEPEQLRALGDDLRAQLVVLLREHARSTSDLAAELGLPKGTVGHHLKVLEGAGLISRSREGKWQRSHLEAVPLRDAAVWIERFRGFWDSSLDRLDAHLATLQQEQESR